MLRNMIKLFFFSRYFSQGNLEENNYISENTNCIYGLVTYQAADCLPHPTSDTYGPFLSPTKLLNTFEKLEYENFVIY